MTQPVQHCNISSPDTIRSGAGMMNNKWRGIRKDWKVKIKLPICEDNTTVNLGNTRELKDKLTHNSNGNHKVLRKRSNRKCKIFVEKNLKNSSEKYEFARCKYNIFLGRKVAYWKDINTPRISVLIQCSVMKIP